MFKALRRFRLNVISSLFFISLVIFFCPVSATIFIEDGSEFDKYDLLEYLEEPAPAFDEPVVIYFYDPYCSACDSAHDFLDSYLEDNPDTILEQINLEDGSDEMDMFREFSDAFNREKAFIPLMYIGPVALEGPDEISEHFDMVYNWYMTSYAG